MNQKIYKCNLCGNIIEKIHEGQGVLTCCNQAMELKIENTQEASQEKHIPVIKQTENGVLIEVGSIAHPMEEAHYIEWIEIITQKNRIIRQALKPGEKPEMLFSGSTDEIKTVRAYCNLHGLWQN